MVQCRSPHGECGLKCRERVLNRVSMQRRSPHGECGLKSVGFAVQERRKSRSPHGECGLKCFVRFWKMGCFSVAPRMGSVD